MGFLKSFLIALFGATFANLVLLFAFAPLVIDPAMPLHALTVGPVLSFTIVGVIGATVVYAVMRAKLRDPDKVFLWTAGVALLLSFIPDILIVGQTSGMFAGGNLSSAILLMAMHVATAGTVVLCLIRLWGGRQTVAI